MYFCESATGDSINTKSRHKNNSIMCKYTQSEKIKIYKNIFKLNLYSYLLLLN